MDNHVQEVRVLRLKFSILAHLFPLFTCVVLVSVGVKIVYLDTVIYYVKEYHQCLVSSPVGAQLSEQYLDYQYPELSIVSAISTQLLVALLVVFFFVQRAARTGLWDMTIGLFQRICCDSKQEQVILTLSGKL